MRKPKVMGLKTATPNEIKEAIALWESRGYTVVHKTEGLPYNGVLVIT